MKKLLLIIMVVCLMPVFSYADEIDDALPPDTPAKVKESARQAIQMGVENQGVIQMTRTMLQNQYKEKQMIQAHEALMKAKQENLPQEPVMNKFNESVAGKKKAKDTIKAMENVRTQYKTANDLAGKMTQDREQARVMAEDMAQCMAAGMKSGDMKKIAKSLQDRTKNMGQQEAQAYRTGTFSTVKQMAQSGASSGSTSKMVRNALKKQYSQQDMGKLQTTFMAQVKNAGSATELANSFANAIKNGATADNIGSYAARGSGSSSGFGQGATGSGSMGNSGGFGSSGGSGSRRGGGGRGR